LKDVADSRATEDAALARLLLDASRRIESLEGMLDAYEGGYGKRETIQQLTEEFAARQLAERQELYDQWVAASEERESVMMQFVAATLLVFQAADHIERSGDLLAAEGVRARLGVLTPASYDKMLEIAAALEEIRRDYKERFAKLGLGPGPYDGLSRNTTDREVLQEWVRHVRDEVQAHVSAIPRQATSIRELAQLADDEPTRAMLNRRARQYEQMAAKLGLQVAPPRRLTQLRDGGTPGE
jgi:hypothetical protein